MFIFSSFFFSVSLPFIFDKNKMQFKTNYGRTWIVVNSEKRKNRKTKSTWFMYKERCILYVVSTINLYRFGSSVSTPTERRMDFCWFFSIRSTQNHRHSQLHYPIRCYIFYIQTLALWCESHSHTENLQFICCGCLSFYWWCRHVNFSIPKINMTIQFIIRCKCV